MTKEQEKWNGGIALRSESFQPAVKARRVKNNLYTY